MAHRTSRAAYDSLIRRLNEFPQGAPPSELLYQILSMLFTVQEAELVAVLPVKPFTVKAASRIWKMKRSEAQRVLDALADKGLLVDFLSGDQRAYVLPPPMAGFFEFSLMRVRNDVDQRALSELFYRYLNEEEDFIKQLLCAGETKIGRVFVHEPVLSADNLLYILDHERASHVVRTASHISVGICYCRHKMQHMGRACDAPQEICLSFNLAAESLIRHGIARQVDVAEGQDLLQQARERNLLQIGENVRDAVTFICNCCGCCCEALIACRRFAALSPLQTTRYLPETDPTSCKGCGKCVVACPVEAMTLVSANDPRRPKRRTTRLDQELCLGCGVCLRACPTGSIRLRSRGQRVLTPVNTAHRTVLMAIERGKLQHLIVDSQVMSSHRAVAAVLGVILKLPPIKQALASKQLQSRYLERLLSRYSRKMPWIWMQ